MYDIDDSEIVDVVEFNIGYVPFVIERVSDGETLKLNEDNSSYSFKDFRSGDSKYSWGRLFMDYRCLGEFKAISWVKIDNLDSAHKKIK